MPGVGRGSAPAPAGGPSLGGLVVLATRRVALGPGRTPRRRFSARRSRVPEGAIRAGASSPRSAPTNGGAGLGIASPPGGATAAVTPESTSANGQPSASARAPSVDGRSPTTTPVVPKRSRISPTVGRGRLARHLRRAPGGGGDRGHDRAGARDQPTGYGIGGVEVGGDEAGAVADRARGPVELVEVERAVEAHDDRRRRARRRPR